MKKMQHYVGEVDFRAAVSQLWRAKVLMSRVHAIAIAIYAESATYDYFTPSPAGFQLGRAREMMDAAMNAMFRFQELIRGALDGLPLQYHDALYWYEAPESEWQEITTPIFTAGYWKFLAEKSHSAQIIDVIPKVAHEGMPAEILMDSYAALVEIEASMGTPEQLGAAQKFCNDTMLDFENFGLPVLKLGVMISAAGHELKDRGYSYTAPRTVLNVSSMSQDSEVVTFQEIKGVADVEPALDLMERVQWFEAHGGEMCGEDV
jgi:hypothetical protein